MGLDCPIIFPYNLYTMKKLLLSILAFCSISAWATENVTLVYSWSPSDSIANIQRNLALEANKLQNKYNFMFDAKPGAGGTVASRYVATTPNTILVTSSAFFIRATVFPNESYNLNDYTTLMAQCTAPMVITSSKYKSWKEVPKNVPLNIGTSGLGVTTHMAALQVVAKYPNVQVVPFKSTSEALVNMVAGNTDFHVGFLSEPEAWAKENNKTVNVLGITGSRTVNGHATLASQGFDSVTERMGVPFQLVISNSVSEVKAREWREILQQAAKAKSVRDGMAFDHCHPTEDTKNLDRWYNEQRDMWKKLAGNISVK